MPWFKRINVPSHGPPHSFNSSEVERAQCTSAKWVNRFRFTQRNNFAVQLSGSGTRVLMLLGQTKWGIVGWMPAPTAELCTVSRWWMILVSYSRSISEVFGLLTPPTFSLLMESNQCQQFLPQSRGDPQNSFNWYRVCLNQPEWMQAVSSLHSLLGWPSKNQQCPSVLWLQPPWRPSGL